MDAPCKTAVLRFEGYTKPPLSENDRMKWWERAPIVKRLRSATGYYAPAAGLQGLGRCRVTLTWHVATRHHRDADNVVLTLKAMCDGVVVDDIPHGQAHARHCLREGRHSSPRATRRANELADRHLVVKAEVDDLLEVLLATAAPDRKSQALWLKKNGRPDLVGFVFSKLDGRDITDAVWRTLEPAGGGSEIATAELLGAAA